MIKALTGRYCHAPFLLITIQRIFHWGAHYVDLASICNLICCASLHCLPGRQSSVFFVLNATREISPSCFQSQKRIRLKVRPYDLTVIKRRHHCSVVCTHSALLISSLALATCRPETKREALHQSQKVKRIRNKISIRSLGRQSQSRSHNQRPQSCAFSAVLPYDLAQAN